jgi:thioredoxin-dependent peroxiredoxin
MKWLILSGLIAALAVAVSRMARGGEVPAAGEVAPDFELPDQNGVRHSLKDYAGKWLVLYFYPKDDTPGCTREACAFRDHLHKLAALGAQVVGISVDESSSHAAFAQKYHLPFTLLADRSAEVAARYGALLNLGFFRMARRYTFLIEPQGRIARVYVKVEPSKHSQEIIEDLKQLNEKGK